jgi:hypothetical protein
LASSSASRASFSDARCAAIALLRAEASSSRPRP